MTLSAVQKNKVWQRRKALIAVKITLYASLQYLLHTRIVVLADNILYCEFPVACLIRSAVAVHYHTADPAVLSEI